MVTMATNVVKPEVVRTKQTRKTILKKLNMHIYFVLP